ncbi:MAG TPA: hypothetical protein VIU40_00860, partial [Geobacteraceae bacterium]
MDYSDGGSWRTEQPHEATWREIQAGWEATQSYQYPAAADLELGRTEYEALDPPYDDGWVDESPVEQDSRIQRSEPDPAESVLQGGTPSERSWYTAQSRAFDEGVQIGAQTEHNAARRAVAGAVLGILGKDRADGPVDLGALGV